MRIAFTTLILLLSFSPVFAAKKPLDRQVRRLIPAQIDLNDPRHAPARKELEQLVDRCGPGVVKGVSRGKNDCDFQVEMDELFFRDTAEKTGYLADPDWAFQEGVTFVSAPDTTTVPDNFDLRDLMENGQPDIRTQRCGDCWAWATHHGLEIARAIHDKKVYDHSIQTVLSCSGAGSCNGGYMSAVDFLAHGLPLETDFPYAASNKRCPFNAGAIQTGWEGKTIGTPYVGNSLNYSRALQFADGSFREGNKVKQMMAAMWQWKSPLVVTVAAYSISGNGIYNNCSAINSGGNHMVTISGFELVNGKRIAHVWNSWGPSHGQNGVSRIQWECGDNRLNRGLGTLAKIVQYKQACTAPDATQVAMHETLQGNGVEIGSVQSPGSTCSWLPTEGLSDPKSCTPKASPNLSTEYHLTVENACGKSSSMTLVHVWPNGQRTAKRANGAEKIRTPFGVIEWKQ